MCEPDRVADFLAYEGESSIVVLGDVRVAGVDMSMASVTVLRRVERMALIPSGRSARAISVVVNPHVVGIATTVVQRSCDLRRLDVVAIVGMECIMSVRLQRALVENDIGVSGLVRIVRRGPVACPGRTDVETADKQHDRRDGQGDSTRPCPATKVSATASKRPHDSTLPGRDQR